ncbi:ABC transporter permease [Mesorhizobium sp.]|uniref:ABC transporter permease n=1 Tax=Mesorhizobium sp. TaxID=1871066 RepID=UPI000FE9E35C|nr:ABC transporter permease [Mesorhizobium sp.]RWJ05741.1 MAG: ABC transporter permease [Mesorhizobium sp.]
MAKYIVKRLMATIPVLILVSLVVFLLLHFAPGDPASLIAGDNASSDEIDAIRRQLRLDQPLPVQFIDWTGRMLRGDLGKSIFSGVDVTTLMGQRAEPTIMLALVAVVLALVIALPLGTIAAFNAGGVIDRLVMAFAMVGFSAPVFVIGFLLVYTFALNFGWFPTQGYSPLSQGLWACLHTLFLPGFTLGLLYASLIARVTRTCLLEVLSEDYVRTARAKGLRSTYVLVRHALPNAAIPIVTVVGIGIATLLGGVVVTETVFNVPGLGRLATDAVLRRDYPVVQALILVFALTYVLINLLVDLSYSYFDPRVRY